jgi:hypothetical protein
MELKMNTINEKSKKILKSDMNFLKMKQEEFKEVFPNMLEIYYQKEKDDWEKRLREIWGKEWRKHNNWYLYNTFDAYKKDAWDAYNREANQTSYEKLYILSTDRHKKYSTFIQAMSNVHNEFCELYWNSKFVEEDARIIAQNRLDEILIGLDLSKINVNLIYESDGVRDNMASFEVFVQLYDERTKIASEKVSLFVTAHNFKLNSVSIVNLRNEQKIRAMVKQFLEDIK